MGYGVGATTYVDPLVTNPGSDIGAGGFDAGIVSGIGVNFAFKNNQDRLVLGVRSTYGMLNYNKYKNAPVANWITASGYIAYDWKLTKKRHYRYRW